MHRPTVNYIDIWHCDYMNHLVCSMSGFDMSRLRARIYQVTITLVRLDIIYQVRSGK